MRLTVKVLAEAFRDLSAPFIVGIQVVRPFI